jgi:DNA repair exonuclease SbcCD ATPase subunit
MPTDPDQDDRIDIDLSDVDLTDELPVLIETAVFESDKRLIAIEEDSELESTARIRALAPHEAESVEALKKDLAERAAQIQALEDDVERLSGRWLEIERTLTEKDNAISSLTGALDSARSALKERRSVEEGLTAEIADRDTRIARLLEKTDLLRKEAAEARTQVERVRQEREIELREIAMLRAELKRRAGGPDGAPEADLREQVDTLTTYIANRRVWWDALETRATAQATRIAELEKALEERSTRTTTVEARAASESTRADGLSAQLAAAASKVEQLDAELKRRETDSATMRSSLDRMSAELERIRGEATEARRDRDEAREALSKLQSDRVGSEPRAESTGVAAYLDAAQKQIADLRAQLDKARADNARLARALVERDRAVTARDERIRTLQIELHQRLGGLDKVSATDVSGPGPATKTSERSQRTEPSGEAASTPTLVCLTSDGPRSFALAKSTITIGRNADCDIQILTHFVSREHARLTVSPKGGVLIEDLGSTNGVFVNSQRIDRQELHHGDVVTVGQTQFRFLETMAH